jgi:EAL domain-containing protein (putative c-di-GMP-specific phosphodiesterase class I)/PAS domain-containing protein
MDAPLRVLVVEHHHARRCVAGQLLIDYDLDFSWRCVGSPLELRQVAADFRPSIVLCADDVSTATPTVLDSLRLLCSQAPTILVSTVCQAEALGVRDATTLFGKALRQSLEGAPDLPGPGAAPAPAPDAEDITHLRRCFSSLLESSSGPAVMSNADGWITHANVSACRRLEASGERSLGTLLDGPIDRTSRDTSPRPVAVASVAVAPAGAWPGQGVHRLVYFDAWTHHPTLIHAHDLIGCVTGSADLDCAALALVTSNLGSARISAETLPDAAGAGDVESDVAHYGSIVRIAPDDFLLVLPALSSARDAAGVAQRVLESIAQTRLAASPGHEAKAAAAVAPVSTYHRPVVSDRSCSSALSRLGDSLGDAMQRHALSIQYQPQFELDTGRGCGVEALARWTLSTGQVIAPSIFIPLAERIGMIHSLGAWVLQSACETAYAWCSRDAQRTTLSVNVSAHQINEEFCAIIGRTLKDSHFPAKQLELEITESALVENTELTIECLKQWKRLGVQIAVDDFGTGYSSLNYLARLPVDRLKLDQSLIQRMTLDPKSKIVMRSIISLGADLGIDVIAEGVETEEQFHMLEDLGCPRAQGYLLGRPMPPKQAQLALRKAWGNRPIPNPGFRPARLPVGESLVQ